MQLRIAGAIQLVQQAKIGFLILSVGKTGNSECSEAEMMQAAALQVGVERKRLILESKSLTTQQNVLFCKSLLQHRSHELEGLSIVLITSDWHMTRAWMIARRHFPS